jgi:hypothetical protein
MGMNLGGMIFLQKKGFLSPSKNRLLDIGPQNVYFATGAQIDAFVNAQGMTVKREHFELERQRLEYFSTPRPEERTTLFSEICDLTNIEYNSFDVCPALKTELLDLNYDQLPERYNCYYDVVLNFGTTEHIFNQWNSFKIIHDALKVGGVVYHQLPASGYLDHGYYCYTPLFFTEIAAANDYEIAEMFLTPAGENFVVAMGIDIRGVEEKLAVPNSLTLDPGADRVPCFNIHVILRKTRSAPFRVGLEIATSHATAYDAMLARYGDTAQAAASRDAKLHPAEFGGWEAIESRISELTVDRERRIDGSVADRERKIEQLVAEREEARSRGDNLAAQVRAIHASRSWRYTEPFRKVARQILGHS